MAENQSGAQGGDDEVGPDIPADVDVEKEYDRFVAEAKALPGEILKYPGGALRAYRMAKRGVDAVKKLGARVKKSLPDFDLARALLMPEMALALLFASRRVDRRQGSPGTIGKSLEQASKLRSLLIKSADALAESGDLPARDVEKIHEGKGPIDLAQDCVDLAALYRRFAHAVVGKTPVTPAQVEEAAKVGSALLTMLQPEGTPAVGTATELSDAVDVRNRLWTMLVTEHKELRGAGAYLFKDKVDAHIPLLQSRVRTKKKPEPEPEPKP